MVVRIDDPGRPTPGQPRGRSFASTAEQMQEKRTFPNFFIDRQGNDTTVEGGLGIDIPGWQIGIPGVATLGQQPSRIGIGGTVQDFGKQIGGNRRPAHGAAIDKPMDFSDYLALAQQLMAENGGSGPDYSAIENALKQQALQSDAKLQAMYNQLRGSINADAPTIAGQYDQAQAAIGQNADQAATNVNGAYQASRDAQTQQLAALGIQDAASVLAANGGNAAADQAHAVGNIEQNRQTGQQQTTLNKASALDYNTNIGNASSLAGGEVRGGLQQQLMGALAEIALRKSQAQSSSGKSSIDLAMQLQDRATPQGLSADDQRQNAQFGYQQQQDQQARQDALFQMLYKQYNGDLKQVGQVFSQLQASGYV